MCCDFWETKFTAVKPMKRGGNRRYYRPEDVELLKAIHHLLYADGYTIKGVQKLFREKGAKGLAVGGAAAPAEPSRSSASSLFDAPAPAVRAAGTDAAFVSSLQVIRDRLATALAEARAA